MSDRVIPQALDAEENILGAALLSPDALAIVVTRLDSQDFFSEAHRTIVGAMKALWERGERRPDGILLADHLTSQGDLENIGGTSKLISLQANVGNTANAERYVPIIQDRALRRRIISTGDLMQDTAYNHDATEALATARSAVDKLGLPVGQGKPSPNITDFLSIETPVNWLVPDLIEKQDRLILTGAEGAGKSQLVRQLAMQFASGIHPWKRLFFSPIRVLVIDVENSPTQIQQAFRPLRIKAGENLLPENLMIESRPQGLDLLNRYDVEWLLDRVSTSKPDIVTIGPIYRLHNEDPNDEMPARKVAQVFDDLRMFYGVSLIIEAHSAKGSGRARSLMPFGASLWLRWPEFGYGLQVARNDKDRYKFVPWRGPRSQRDWPEYLRRGGDWPWTQEAKQERAF